ncbi:MAG: hypothetical protein U1E65_27425 [Myxococcota bacterium]
MKLRLLHIRATQQADAPQVSAAETPPPPPLTSIEPPPAKLLGVVRKLPEVATQTAPSSLVERLDSDVPLPPRKGRVTPVVLEGVVDPKSTGPLTHADIARLRERLDAGDRAGMYLELYQRTGQDIWLMHAQITSYSGVFGGTALTANYLAKMSHPGTYHVALDTFSRQIAASMLKVIERNLDAGGDGKVSVGELRTEGDLGVWKSKGMGDAFPGNGLFFQVQYHGLSGLPQFFTKGTAFGAEAILRAAQNGKRPSEFRNHRRYDLRESTDKRFVTVLDKKTGKVEAFFDKKALVAGVFSQIEDQPLTPGERRFHERAALWEMMQANQDHEQPFHQAMAAQGKSFPTPNLLSGGDDSEGLFARRIFYSSGVGRWFADGEPLALSDPGLVQACDQLRKHAMAERKALGLPEETQMPQRYMEAALFRRLGEARSPL